MMKTIKLLLLGMVVAFGSTAQIKTPFPSSAGSVGSTVGLTEVSIEYFRPKKKGRKIFGAGDEYLVKYGEMWRTGANSGSKLELSTDVQIGGEEVKAGKYLILTIPGKDEWSFILYSDVSLGGNVAGYEDSKKVLKLQIKPVKLNDVVETMTFGISDISEDNNTANIYFAWENTGLKVPLKVDYDDIVMEEIAKKTKVNPQNYATAANYYLSTDKDLNQALKWMNKYLAVEGNTDQFWHVHTKARILAKLGKKKEAIAAAEESKKKAADNSSGDFGYVKRNDNLIAEIKGK